MASAQMALPMEARRNGASGPRQAPQGPVLDPAPVPAGPVVMSEVPRWVRRTTTVGVLVVALVAAIGSYEHMRTLGVEVGEGWRAGLLPFSVDGLALVAAMTMLVRRW